MSICCECCELSGRGLCDGLISCTEESYGCLSLRSADHFYRGVVCMSVYCECCVLSVIVRWAGMITCTDESYGCQSVVCVVCCQVEASASC